MCSSDLADGVLTWSDVIPGTYQVKILDCSDPTRYLEQTFLVKINSGLTTSQTVVMGTAGSTVALSVLTYVDPAQSPQLTALYVGLKDDNDEIKYVAASSASGGLERATFENVSDGDYTIEFMSPGSLASGPLTVSNFSRDENL